MRSRLVLKDKMLEVRYAFRAEKSGDVYGRSLLVYDSCQTAIESKLIPPDEEDVS